MKRRKKIKIKFSLSTLSSLTCRFDFFVLFFFVFIFYLFIYLLFLFLLFEYMVHIILFGSVSTLKQFFFQFTLF